MRSCAPRAPLFALLAVAFAPAITTLTTTPAVRGAPASVPPAAGPKPLAETLTGEAKTDYEAAGTAYGAQDYVVAGLKYRAAYDKSKDARLLWNVATCEKKLRRYVKVRALVRQYLAEGGALLTSKDREEGEDLIRAIEPFIASLKISVNEPGAEVFVDDERIGVSPLPTSLPIDLGSRKVRVRKAGFKDFETTVAIGGDKEARIEVKLTPEVHAGALKVKAPDGAHIAIDNQDVGIGTWSGTLKSGGHTLRVTAPGMRSYQAEIGLQDGDDRTLDVALDPLGAVAPPEEAGPIFTLGLRTGYGSIGRGGGAGVLPVWLDLGFHLGRVFEVGIFAQVGKITTGSSCATSAHGPTAASPSDFEVRYSFDSCSYLKPGLEFLFHTRPRSKVDPWFGFDWGFYYQRSTARTYDPLGGAGTDSVRTLAIQVGAQLGVDVHVVDGYRPLTVGGFVATTLAIFGDDNFDRLSGASSGSSGAGSHNKSKIGIGKDSVGFTLILGARTALNF